MSHRSIVDTHKRYFERHLEKAGFWAVYTRSDRRFRCTECFNPDTGDSPANCGSCFGTGWKTTLERWFVAHAQSLFRAPIAQAPITRIGISTEHSGYFFTPDNLIPVIGDRFFIVEWTQSRDLVALHSAQPTRLVEAFRIHYVEPFVAGSVVYYTSHCEFVTEDKRAYEQALLSTAITVSRS